MPSLLDLLPHYHTTISLGDTGRLMLPITTTVLGLVYAAFIYWLQGGFSRLEHTRSLLEDLLVAEARITLDLLVGSSLISLFAIMESRALVGVTFWIFVIVLMSDLLKATAETGYIVTIFSTKFIPANYGPTRQLLRKIQNAGPSSWIRPVFFIGILVGYPVSLSWNLPEWPQLSDKGAIMFVFAAAAMSLLQIKPLLTQAFDTRKEIERHSMNENQQKALSLEDQSIEWSSDKREFERKIISERLGSVGLVPDFLHPELNVQPSWTSRDLTDRPVIQGLPWVQEHGNCHLNMVIPYLTSDDDTRKFIFEWTRTILKVLAESKTEVSQYGVSFWRRDGGTTDTHFGIMRASRDDVLKALAKNLQGREFIRSLPGRYLSDAVAEF